MRQRPRSRALLAGLGQDRNRLRRGVDRLEAAIMAALVVAFVIGAPLAGVITGRVADSAAVRQRQAELTSWHRVPATLLQSAAEEVADYGYLATAWVPARWTLPDGQARTGLLAVALNAQAGQTVYVWINQAGQLTPAPLAKTGVWDQVAFDVLSVIIALAGLLALLALSVRLLCDRRRIDGWQRAWDAVGPRWSRLG
jgi:hypothetical protein